MKIIFGVILIIFGIGLIKYFGTEPVIMAISLPISFFGAMVIKKGLFKNDL